MNKKNLMDAFGEIDEELFAGADLSEFSSKKPEEAVAPVFIEGGKRRRGKRPFIYMGAGIAACAALAVSLPMLANNAKPPYESGAFSEPYSQQYQPTDLTEPADTSAEEAASSAEETEPLLTLPYDEDFKYELYGKNKEFLDAEKLYYFDVQDINIEKFNKNGSHDIDILLLSMFYGNLTYLDGDELYYSESVNDPAYDASVNAEHEDWAGIYKYNLVTEETDFVFKEKSNDDDFGLMLKIAAIDSDWLYYYHIQSRNGYEESTAEFWRYNLADGRKEKIVDVGDTYYANVSGAEKSGDYLYFAFTSLENYRNDEHGFLTWDYVPYIYSFNTKDESLELVKKTDCTSIAGLYKDGIIYACGDEYFYHKNGADKDELLFDVGQIFDLESYYSCSCGFFTLKSEKLMYVYTRDDNNITVSTFGYLDDEFKPHELLTAQGHMWFSEDYNNLLTFELGPNEETQFIYDDESGAFSSFKIPKEAINKNGTRVYEYYVNTSEGLKLIVFECDDPKRNNYWWAKLYTIKQENKIFTF